MLAKYGINNIYMIEKVFFFEKILTFQLATIEQFILPWIVLTWLRKLKLN